MLEKYYDIMSTYKKYIESSINLFNQQIKDDIDIEKTENIDSIIHEAIALDNVINRKSRNIIAVRL